jgi:hypothetical protein
MNEVFKNRSRLMTSKAKSMASRKRNWFAVIGTTIMILLWLITDPDMRIITNMPAGAKVLDIFTVLSKGVIYMMAVHMGRKYILDYINLKMLIDKAAETSEGAGKAAIAVSIYTVAMAIAVYAAVNVA